MDPLNDQLRDLLCDTFGIAPARYHIAPHGHGLINRTYVLHDRTEQQHWLLQQVNTAIFPRPDLIASNNHLAAEHLRTHHPAYRFMRAVRTRHGADFLQHPESGAWRMFPYYAGTFSPEQAATPAQARSAAQQFGRLVRLLAGADVDTFHTIIPGFHDTAARYAHFQHSIASATPERRTQAQELIGFYLDHAPIVEEYRAVMADPAVRTCITHNDTKLNNVLFDEATGHAVCVVDLDTLMPGKALFDLGDMIRTCITATAEDDPDPAHIRIDADVFEQLVLGWTSEMAPLLSATERGLLYWSGKLLIFEQGIRFLTDHLMNDVYYRTDRPLHNVHRAMNQMHLLDAYLQRGTELEGRALRALKAVVEA